ncbi:hypothetical protein PG991_011142 [Apiospora marii]|uniref:Uncharacterized protein n=1 Tax=Apiospora marii TaxID=335849 RepID=A0ABR1RDC5_9PEZI
MLPLLLMRDTTTGEEAKELEGVTKQTLATNRASEELVDGKTTNAPTRTRIRSLTSGAGEDDGRPANGG